MPRMLICKHTFNNSCTFPRFMVGCGRCEDWFHGDCVGLDLTKVREMEEEDQMYVCLKCCDEESRKVEPEPPSAPKPEVPAKTEVLDQKLPPKPKPEPGSSQSLTSGGVRPVRKVSTNSSYKENGSSWIEEMEILHIQPKIIKNTYHD